MKYLKKKLFGLKTSIDESYINIIPVPWEATLSPPSGTFETPENIIRSSTQVSVCDINKPNSWKVGISMVELPNEWAMLSKQLQSVVTGYVNSLEINAKSVYSTKSITLKKINEYCYDLKEQIKNTAKAILKKGKIAAVLGGDNSTSLGLIEALSETTTEFGILQFDAHANLLKNYQGFEYSYASVMHNAVNIPQVTKLVQVATRSMHHEELEIINVSKSLIETFFDEHIKNEQFKGVKWEDIANKIIESLPHKVYISFDIDALDSKLCPGTAFPVPGGLDYYQAIYIIKTLVKSGREIIGFDLCQVANNESSDWDYIVASKLLFDLMTQTATSQGLI